MIAAAASGVVVAPSRADAKRSDVVVAFAGASLPLAMARSLGILTYRLVTSVAYQLVTEPDGQPSVPVERDDFSSIRHPALGYCWSMIFSENRYPLFGIMLEEMRTSSPATADFRPGSAAGGCACRSHDRRRWRWRPPCRHWPVRRGL